jgi:hypothetical protein
MLEAEDGPYVWPIAVTALSVQACPASTSDIIKDITALPLSTVAQQLFTSPPAGGHKEGSPGPACPGG